MRICTVSLGEKVTSEKKQEYTRKISAANRAQLITVIYDITLTYLEDAKEAHYAGDEAQTEHALRRARRCLDELISALDMQYELSVTLQNTYLLCKRKLSLAQARRDLKQVEETTSMITRLRDAWKQIESLDDSEAGFDNAQTVYAGLTYGRGTLNESVADPCTNRGFLG